MFSSFLQSQQEVVLDRVASIVENKIVLLSDVVLAANAVAAQENINPNSNPLKYQKILESSRESMIEQLLIIEMAEQDSVEVLEKDIDSALEQQIEMSIAKFEEDIKSAGHSIQKKLKLSKHELYGGLAFLVQLVELNGIDEYLKYKSFVCDVQLASHPNDRGYEEVRKDLPDVKERIKGYVRETRELNDLEKLFCF